MRLNMLRLLLAAGWLVVVLLGCGEKEAEQPTGVEEPTVLEKVEPNVAAPLEEVVLFNGVDFSGWKLFIPDETVDVNTVWSIEEGVIHCTGVPSGYIRTAADYSNYQLHVEWRWVEEAGNSGILLHMTGEDKVWPKSIECQLQAGNAGDFYLIDGTYFKALPEGNRLAKKSASNEKPAGAWNSADITCKDDKIWVLINGELQNEGEQASVQAGKICLQSEGRPIEFRNLYLEPLG